MNKKNNKNEKLDLNKVSGGTDLVYINNVVKDKDGRYRLANYNNNLREYVKAPNDMGVDINSIQGVIDIRVLDVGT